MESDQYIRMMERWSVTAKDCTQMATAALVLPTVFIRNLLSVPENDEIWSKLDWPFITSWSCLGVAILTGLTYQITVARLMQHALGATGAPKLYPRVQFWTMIGAFLLGLAFFVLGVARS
jgi:hypothetical protein